MTMSGWSRDEVYEQLKTVLVKEFGLGESRLALDAHLVKDLDLDSIDWIDMAVALEERTGQELTEEEMTSIRTIGDVVEAVYRKLQPGTV